MTCGAESPLAQDWLPWTHCMLGPAGIGMSAACRPEEVVCGYDESLGWHLWACRQNLQNSNNKLLPRFILSNLIMCSQIAKDSDSEFRAAQHLQLASAVHLHNCSCSNAPRVRAGVTRRKWEAAKSSSSGCAVCTTLSTAA